MAISRYADIVSRIQLLGFDRAQMQLTGFQSGLTTLASRAHMAGAAMLKMGGMMAAGMGVIVGKAIKDTAAFETALVDMGKVTDESLDSIRKKMMELPPELGSATELVKGYYEVLSAGIKDPVKSLEVLTMAAKTAKAAHIDQAEVIKGLTKMMEGYEGQIKSASEAADLLFAIEKAGQAKVAELIPVVGGLAKISHDLGISQDEMGASLAVVTKTAGTTAEAATYYKMILVALMKPSETMKEALEDIGKKTRGVGFESAQAAIKALGLAGVLKELKEWTGGSAEKMGELFGRLGGLLGMSALSGRNFEALTAAIEEMGKKTGTVDKAFEDWKKTLGAIWDVFKATLGKMTIEIGTLLMPVVKRLIEWVTNLIKKFNELDEGLKKNLVRWAVLTPVILLVAGTIALLAGHLLNLGVSLVHLIPRIIAFTQSMAAARLALAGWTVAAAASIVITGLAVREGVKLVKAKQDEKKALEGAADVLARFNKDSREHLAIVKKASKYKVEDLYGDPEKVQDVRNAISVLNVMAKSHDKDAADVAKRQRDRMKVLIAGYEEIKDKDKETAGNMIDNATRMAGINKISEEEMKKRLDLAKDVVREKASIEEELLAKIKGIEEEKANIRSEIAHREEDREVAIAKARQLATGEAVGYWDEVYDMVETARNHGIENAEFELERKSDALKEWIGQNENAQYALQKVGLLGGDVEKERMEERLVALDKEKSETATLMEIRLKGLDEIVAKEQLINEIMAARMALIGPGGKIVPSFYQDNKFEFNVDTDKMKDGVKEAIDEKVGELEEQMKEAEVEMKRNIIATQ